VTRRGPLLLVALQAACHASAAALYALQRGGFGLPAAWDRQCAILIALSFLATALTVLRRGTAFSKGALALALFACLLACYPLPLGSGVQLALGLPLIATAAAAFERPDYLASGPIIIGLLAMTVRGGRVWGSVKTGANPAESLLFCTVLLFAFALIAALRELDHARERALREVARLDRAMDRITAINASFQNALAAAEEEYARKERNRITREIHDIVGYALTNQQMMLEAALMLAAPGEGRLRELLAMAREGVGEGLRETRRTLYGLRPHDEARRADFGLLLKITRNFQAVTGVHVSVDLAGARGDLDQAAWMTVYRLVQESMINAFRHGRAQNISIFFREDSQSFHVAVHDDGSGVPLLAEGLGLTGMRERLASIGGELSAGNAAGGFLVEARIPTRGAREEGK
jgi:signal transduction histidine kinase